jgi:hypothetical protein
MNNEENKLNEVNPDPANPLMPHKTLILIGVLSFITLVLLGLAIFVGLPNNNSTPKKEVHILQTALDISQPTISSSTYTSNITLTTERSKVTAIQIELKYDPIALTNVDIKPGTFFPNPTIISKKIDTINGRISYLLGIGLGQVPVNGNGKVAILSFTPALKNGTTTISFLKTSKATVSTEVSSVLTAAHGIQFPFGK